MKKVSVTLIYSAQGEMISTEKKKEEIQAFFCFFSL